VLDWLMPDLSGEHVLKLLRESQPTLPVVLISGYSTEALPSSGPHLTRVQKPMTLAQLRLAIQQVTGSHPADSALSAALRLKH